ncbi:hypothetical protein JZO82_04115 [Vagococcus fluvialis]|uniref:hypothetical protein n=1 Tax=Vagococcus fluvialis TaxID=2738 RepID=UPI001A8FA272|nr:hypothetical protein [Vagococcus fluvialis]MBO0428341.1 hypothetical protein [Vagococcus fluvialis]
MKLTLFILSSFFILLLLIYLSLRKVKEEQKSIRKEIQTNLKEEIINRLSVFGNVEYSDRYYHDEPPIYSLIIETEIDKKINSIIASIGQLKDTNQFILEITHRFERDLYGGDKFNDLIKTLSKNGYEVTLDTSCDYFVTLGIKTKKACYKEELFIKITSVCSLIEEFYQEDNSEESQNSTEEVSNSLVFVQHSKYLLDNY